MGEEDNDKYRTLYRVGIGVLLLLAGVLLLTLVALEVTSLRMMKQLVATPEKEKATRQQVHRSREYDDWDLENPGAQAATETQEIPMDQDIPKVPTVPTVPEALEIPGVSESSEVQAVPTQTVPAVQHSRRSSSTRKIPSEVLTQEGMTLRILAARYYGNEVFWVCIYDYNSRILRDPAVLPSGIRLRLPRRADYGIDPSDPVSIHRARMLGKMIFRRG
ncbi:LysM peptidoglycan-binding domain-containing protein [Parabacteroides sp.]